MGDFDQAGRYLIRCVPRGFFAWLSPRFVAAWTFRGWIDTRTLAFPGEPDRTCDTVAEFVRADDPQRRCLLDVEVQSRPHPDMPERLGEYAFRLRREHRYGRGRRGKYLVLSVLLNLTGAEQPHVFTLTDETLNGAGMRMQIFQRTLREEDAETTLSRMASGDLERRILPWVVLMQGAGRPAIIEEWKRLAAQERDEQLRSDLGGLALVFSELTRHKGIWNRGLERWNMQRSKHVLEWLGQGRVEGGRLALLRVLQSRFRIAVPQDLATAVSGLNDLEEINRWLDLAVTAPSLDSFRSAVRQ